MESLRLVYDSETDSGAAAAGASVGDTILAAEQDLVVMFVDLVGFSRISATIGSRASGVLLSPESVFGVAMSRSCEIAMPLAA